MSTPHQAGSPRPPAVALLRSRWRFLAQVFAVGVVGSVVHALLAPRWYESEITVVPVAQPKMAGAIAGALASALDAPIDLGVGSSETDRVAAVFRSRSVTDAVIRKFNLQRRYGKRYLEKARKELWRHCSIRTEKKSSFVTLTCEDRDAKFARAMLDYFGQVGNDVLRRVSVSSASEERRFLERRVEEARHAVEVASQCLRGFQEEHRVVDLTEQSRASISAVAALQGELLSKQMQLEYLAGFSAPDETTSQQLRKQIAVMKSKLRSLEGDLIFVSSVETPNSDASGAGPRTRPAPRDGAGVFPRMMDVPRLRFELEQLYRDQKVQETVFLLLTQRFEMAKVNEARDTSAFQVVDPPVVATYRSRPVVALLIAGETTLALVAALAWILAPPWWRSRARRP